MRLGLPQAQFQRALSQRVPNGPYPFRIGCEGGAGFRLPPALVGAHVGMQPHRFRGILERAAIAGIQVGFRCRAFRQQDIVAVEFDVVDGDFLTAIIPHDGRVIDQIKIAVDQIKNNNTAAVS